MAAAVSQYPISLSLYCRTGVRRGYQQANAMAYGQVVEVVADKCGAGDTDAKLCLELLKGGWFVFDAHQAVFDAQLPGSHLGGATFAAAQKSQLQARLLQ